MDSKENMSFYRKGKVFATKGRSKHVSEYDVIGDSLAEDGTRTIVMKPTDKTVHLRLCRELAEAMVEKLGEGKNRLLRRMLFDTLRDYRDKEVEDMHRKVILRQAPVKHREGCFKIVIGDGRRSDRDEIMLVE